MFTSIIKRIALLLALGFAAPAAADDVAATARGVVRVVTIAVVDDQVVGFGHGSGFAVAPNRIVTNAHVVELAQRYPDNVLVGVVPSEGSKSYRGRVVAIDAQRDLALIEFDGAALPPAALYTGPSTEGDSVVALGYPGNVDLATARSAADFITPLSPVRSEGVFSGRRALQGTEVLLHTAGIARGNSGGPLLDRCGRVIGVNSAITHGEDGDSSFGFAIADSALAAFLREANQPYAAVGTACTSIEDRLRADGDADKRAAGAADQAQRDAAAAASVQRAAAQQRDAADAARGRENAIALAALLLVGGALAIGASGLLTTRGRRTAAIWAGSTGAAAIVAAVVVFVLRPTGEVIVPHGGLASAAAQPPVASALPADTGEALGKLSCTFQPERSRVVVSSTANVYLDWGAGGCMNGHTPYAQTGTHWERLLVPKVEQTVSIVSFDPATRTYAATHYFLPAEAMTAMRKLRGVEAKGCVVDPTSTARSAAAEAAIRAQLPPLPNEKLVYACAKGG